MTGVRSGLRKGLAGTACKAVLMDLDGTLVLSEDVHRRAWQAFFDAWAVKITEAEYEQHYMGRRPADVITGVPGPWTGTDSVAALATMTAFTLDHADSVQVVPGATELIRQLRTKYLLSVVTSAGAQWARRILENVLDVRGLVDVVVTSEDITCGKPSPEGYLRACAALRVRPEQCLAFEDSPSGVRSLVAAGVRDIVGVTTTATAADLTHAGARWTVADLTPRSMQHIRGSISTRTGAPASSDTEAEA